VADVKAIRDRLGTNAKAAVSSVYVSDFMPSTPILPALIIAPPTGTVLTQVTIDGCEDLELTALVLVSKVVDENAQNVLDTYLSEGGSNIRAALEAGPSTDWDFVMSDPIRSYGQYTFGAGDAAQTFLGFEIPLTVGVS
jgi:hypothetical protein